MFQSPIASTQRRPLSVASAICLRGSLLPALKPRPHFRYLLQIETIPGFLTTNLAHCCRGFVVRPSASWHGGKHLMPFLMPFSTTNMVWIAFTACFGGLRMVARFLSASTIYWSSSFPKAMTRTTSSEFRELQIAPGKLA